jgi:predicted protein tyrosine phosphatase
MFRIKRTTHVSKSAVEKFIPQPGDTTRRALISITTPGFPDAVIPSHVWTSVLRLKFHDYTHDDGVHKVITIQQTSEILKFLSSVQGDVDELIVHCEAGVSRSASVAKFVAEIYNLDFDQTYNRHNRYVYSMLRQIYGKSLGVRSYQPPGFYQSWGK